LLTTDPDMTVAGVDAVDAMLAAAGDARAFERLYRGHVGRVHGLACRMMGRDEAHDVTQEVFVRAWSKLRTFRGESAFGTWLHRVAVNVILTKRSAVRVEQGRLAHDEAIFDVLPAKPAGREHRVDMERAVRKLPEGAREIFVLHDVEGYKHHEIAELLGISIGTSKAQLHRARMLLRKHLHG
jgi:RNA polymerase sigma-70 factor (ECF subfamily)